MIPCRVALVMGYLESGNRTRVTWFGDPRGSLKGISHVLLSF